MTLELVGALILVGCYLTSYVIRDKAYAQLTPQQIGELVVAFRPFRRTYFIGMIALFATLAAMYLLAPSKRNEMFLTFLALSVVFIAVRELHGWRLLKTFALPTSFMTRYRVGRILVVVGFTALVAGFVPGWLTA